MRQSGFDYSESFKLKWRVKVCFFWVTLSVALENSYLGFPLVYIYL